VHICPNDLEENQQIDSPALAILVEDIKIEAEQKVACNLRADDKAFICHHGRQNKAGNRQYIPVPFPHHPEQEEKCGDHGCYSERNQPADPGKVVYEMDKDLEKPVRIGAGMLGRNVRKGIGSGYLEIFNDELAGL